MHNSYGEVLDVRLKRAPTGPDQYAVVKFRTLAAAAAAAEELSFQPLPHLTHTRVKVREWVEDTPRSGPWRRDAERQHEQRSTAWADAKDGEEAAGQGWWEGEEDAHGSEDEENDPLVELWVGNLCSRATRVTLRRAFECFGDVARVQLQQAPLGEQLQFAFVQLPASAAETALEELDGLVVFELSGDMPLKVKQSTRSLKPLLHAQQRQAKQQQWQQHAPGGAAAAGGDAFSAAAAGGQMAAVCDDGSVAPLQGTPRRIKKMIVCEGPPSRTLWLGNVGGFATVDDMHAVLCRYGSVLKVHLHEAPGLKNSFKFGFVQMGSAAEAERARNALQGASGAAICASKPLKLRYAWPQHRLRPLGPGRGAAEQQQHAASQGSDSQLAQAAGSDRGGMALVPDAAAPCCAACGATDAALRRCSACQCVRYCSTACQTTHWGEQHHQDCRRLAEIGRVLGELALPQLLQLLLAALRQPAGRQAQLVQAAATQQGPAGPG